MSAVRRLSAILAADIAGFSRLIEIDEEGTLHRLGVLRDQIIDPKILEHHGRIFKTMGDGLFVEFGSVIDALRCATEVQAAVADDHARLRKDPVIEFRIDIHQGDVVAEGDDILGDGVNVAARLEGLADPGGICVSGRVQEDAIGKLDLSFVDMGEQYLKNIVRPIRTYRVRNINGLATCDWSLRRRLGLHHHRIRCQFGRNVPVYPYHNKHFCIFHFPLSEDPDAPTHPQYLLADETDTDVISMLESEVQSWMSTEQPIDLSGIVIVVPFNLDLLCQLLTDDGQATKNISFIHLPESTFWAPVQISIMAPTLILDFARAQFLENFSIYACDLGTLDIRQCKFTARVQLGDVIRPVNINQFLASQATFADDVIGEQLRISALFDLSSGTLSGKPCGLELRDFSCGDFQAQGLTANGRVTVSNSTFFRACQLLRR